MALRESGVRLVAEGASEFENTLNRAERAVSDFGSQAGGAGASGLERMSLATVALGTALGNLATQAINAAGSALTNFISSGFQYNKSLENAEAQLLAFTGSQEKAAEVLAMVERRAALTPFAFDEMATSAAGLAAISRSTGQDLEGLLGIAERLAASNPAEGLEGAAFALREAFSGDFVSLQERFNIPKDMLKDLKEGGITVQELSDAFNTLGISTDLVSNLAGTFDGRLSTLMDTITRLAGAFTQPIFDFFSEAIGGLQVGLDANIEAWMTWSSSLGQIVADSFQTFQEAWTGQWEDDEIILPIHSFIGNAALLLRKGFDGFSAIANEVIPQIMQGWQDLTSEIESLKKSWGPFNEMVDAAVGLFETLGGFIEDVVTAFTGVDREGDKAHKQLSNVHTVGQFLNQLFSDLKTEIQAVSNWLNILRDRWNAWVDAAANAWEALAGFATGVTPEGNTLQDLQNQSTTPATGDTNNGPNVIVPIPPPPPTTGNRGSNNISINVVVPPNVSPATATQIASDSINQALRARGM